MDVKQSHMFYMGEPCSEEQFSASFIGDIFSNSDHEMMLLPYPNSSEMNSMISEAELVHCNGELDHEFWTQDRIMIGIVIAIARSLDRRLTSSCIKLPKESEFLEQINDSNFFNNYEDHKTRKLGYWYISTTIIFCVDDLSFGMKERITKDNGHLSLYFNNYLTKPDYLTTMALLRHPLKLNTNDEYRSTRLIINHNHLRQFLCGLNSNYMANLDAGDSTVTAYKIVKNNLIVTLDNESCFNWFKLGEIPEDCDLDNKPDRFSEQFYDHYYCPYECYVERGKRMKLALQLNGEGELKYLFASQLVGNYLNYYYKKVYSSSLYSGYMRGPSMPLVIRNAIHYLMLYCKFFLQNKVDDNFINVICNILIQKSSDEAHLSLLKDMFVMPFLSWEEDRFRNGCLECPLDINQLAMLFEKWLEHYPYYHHLNVIRDNDSLSYLMEYSEFHSMINKLKLKINFE